MNSEFFGTQWSLQKPEFIRKGYYAPLVMSNGVDFCQLDFSGSMVFKDHIKGYMSYWYRKGRPNNGDPWGIAKLSYSLITPKGPVEIGDFSQHFDPRGRILYSRVSMYQLEMRITSFLTGDHTFFEIFEITECGAEDAVFALNILFPGRSYTGKPLDAFGGVKNSIEILASGDGSPHFAYSGRNGDCAFRGVGISKVKIIAGTPEIERNAGDSALISIKLKGLKAGTVFARITTVLDSLDGPDYEELANRINAKYMRQSLPDSFRSYLDASGKDNAASFRCDDDALSRLFDVSVYVCGASLHPNGSTVSALAVPNGHGMGTYWDIWYIHRAMLAASRIDAAEKIINFWKMVYPNARKLAKERYNAAGARYAWVLRCDGQPHYDAEQFHNNLIPVLNIWDQYLFTENENILRENFELMQDCIRFIISGTLKKDDNGNYYLRELICVDESIKKKRNDLLTAAATKRCIGILREASAIIRLETDDMILSSEAAFDSILDSLRQDGGYLAYEGAETGNWAVILAYLHLPEPEVLSRAVAGIEAGCQESHGMGLSHSSRMRCATWPWVEGIFAWSLAVNRNPAAVNYLLQMSRFTNFYGGLPEYVWDHSEPSREWFVAAHGVFIAALHEILFKVEGNVIEFLPLGIAALPWNNISICNFRLPAAVLISMDVQKTAGSCVMKLTSVSASEKKLIVRYGGNSEDFILKPNHYHRIIFKIC